MKKFLISLIITGMVSTGIVLADVSFCGIGARLEKDLYNKKVFVRKVFPNSAAAKANLPEGAEIIAINGQKTKDLNINQVTNLVRGEEGTKVQLQIKYYKKESTIEIPRAPFTFVNPPEDKFETYWKQIAPAGLNLDPIPHNMQISMSKQAKELTEYWIMKKEKFKSAYNTCMTYPEVKQEACLNNIVNLYKGNTLK